MRQRLRGQAQFLNAKTGERQYVPAFLHDVVGLCEYWFGPELRTGRLGERHDKSAAQYDLRRLLSVHLRVRQRNEGTPALVI